MTTCPITHANGMGLPSLTQMIDFSYWESALPYWQLRDADNLLQLKKGRTEKDRMMYINYSVRIFTNNRVFGDTATHRNLMRAMAKRTLEAAYCNNLLTDEQKNWFLMEKLKGFENHLEVIG